MSKGMAGLSCKSFATLRGALLAGALLAAYANHFYNSFHFDDAHTIVNNAAIRALRNIPLFSMTLRALVRSRATNHIVRLFRLCLQSITGSAR